MSVAGRMFAAVYDPVMARTENAGLRDRRLGLLADVRGDVLEIGGGTGANLSCYGAEVATLTIVEPEPAMMRRLQERARDHVHAPSVVQAPAEELPFEAESFDVAVSTLVLCTVDDPDRSLRELRRVLRPGGELRFIEHVRSDQPRLARWQDRLRPVNRVVACGCTCNRTTLVAIESAGFAVGDVEHGELPKAPPWIRPLVAGIATRAGEPSGR